MIIGDPAQFAIECVIQDWVDDIWVFGHFRFWLGGRTVGDWEDITSLKGCVSWIRDFIDIDEQRFDPMLTGKSKEEVFHMLYDSVMDPTLSDQSVSIEDSSDIYLRYHISNLGMSSFNRIGLLLIETPECQRVIWHETGDATSRRRGCRSAKCNGLGRRSVSGFRSWIITRSALLAANRRKEYWDN